MVLEMDLPDGGGGRSLEGKPDKRIDHYVRKLGEYRKINARGNVRPTI